MMPPIPDFLIATAENTRAARAAWRPRRGVTKRKAKCHPFHLPRNIEPAGLALLKQIEKEKKMKAAARFKLLRAASPKRR